MNNIFKLIGKHFDKISIIYHSLFIIFILWTIYIKEKNQIIDKYFIKALGSFVILYGLIIFNYGYVIFNKKI